MGQTKVHPRNAARRGFSLMEVLLLVVVLGIVGGAAGQALQGLASVPSQTDLSLQIETQLISKMEQIRGMPFSSVFEGSPSTLSDSVTIAGNSYTRLVTVVDADANGDGNAELTFKQVTVTCGGQTVTTLISQ